jgi:hypothetical protein
LLRGIRCLVAGFAASSADLDQCQAAGLAKSGLIARSDIKAHVALDDDPATAEQVRQLRIVQLEPGLQVAARRVLRGFRRPFAGKDDNVVAIL